MELPRTIQIGYDILKEIGLFIKRFDSLEKVLVVTGHNVGELTNGIVEDSLRTEGLYTSWYRCTSSTMDEVEKVRDAIKNQDAGLVIGLGGGKSVDLAKLGSFQAGVKFVSVPSSASHDGISSPFASIRGEGRPYSYITKPPIGVLADVDLIAQAPHRLLASGCGDLVAKFTAVKDWEMGREEKGEYYGAYAASLALLSAELVVSESEKIGSGAREYVRDVVEALISAGVAAGIAGSSRPCSGSEHLFSHALDILAPGIGLHGEKCGLGTIMVANLQELDWEKIKKALEVVHAPTKASDIGLDENKVVEAMVMAPTIRPERHTILHKLRLNSDSARRLAKETDVI